MWKSKTFILNIQPLIGAGIMSHKQIDMRIGKLLKLRRTMMGLSQNDMARALGITFQQVQKYEKGIDSLNAKWLYELSQLLLVPVTYFFEEAVITPTSEIAQSEQEIHASDRELLEMMKAFKQINSPLIREQIADFIKSFSS